MPIVAGDIDFFKSSSGVGLGGAISVTEIVSASSNNIFDEVSGAEASAGSTEYRCFYVKNSHGSLTLQAAKIWMVSDTPEGDTAYEFALGTSAVNGTEQTVANETTAPSGVTWETATGEGNALTIGDIPAGQHKAIWLKRVVDAAAGAVTDTAATFRVKGDTAA